MPLPSIGPQYYVEFLGWMECYGVRGEKYTEPVIRELRHRQKRKKADVPPKLTILVTDEGLHISQSVDSKKKNSTKTIQFPVIPGRDVTFVHQARRPGDGRLDDIVACIYLGYMPRTNRCVHVHVYSFADAVTASDFCTKMAAIVKQNGHHILEEERRLANERQIEPPATLVQADNTDEPHATDSAVGSASSGYSDEYPDTPFGPRKIEPDLESLADVLPYDNIQDEIRHKMQSENSPILLPPIDYDTISRKHGNLMKVDERRCKHEKIVGLLALKLKERNDSSESGVDLASPTPSITEKNSRNKIPDAPAPPLQMNTTATPPPPPLPKPSPPSETVPPTKVQDKPVINGHRRQHSQGAAAAVIPQADAFVVYPPKKSSPPMSPRLYRQALDNAHGQLYRQSSTHSDKQSPRLSRSHYSSENLGQALLRQSSTGSNSAVPPFQRQSSTGSNSAVPPFQRQNSSSSNNSFRLSQSSDHDKSQEEGKIVYYKGANSEDLYALPSKGPHAARHSQHLPYSDSDAFPPADYNDEPQEEVRMRRNPRSAYRQPHLTRSMPVDMIRSEMALSSSGSRPGSGEFRHIRRTDSPSFVGVNRVSSPHFVGGRRTDSPAFAAEGRTESPVIFAKRIDSPSFMQGPQGFPMY
ncbi:hypothetical protein ElyMa_000476300 [Elysia marginata]|uniref:PID domain-containing protein n=1 Tax=Elysia marginata TaxID=1093978 RepID=A0AAV4FSY9_9GAST|nr:hypothetical protein ElyMa_000476300 [Elysia marginata]